MEIDRKSIGTLIKELTTVTVLCFMAQEKIRTAQTVEEKAAAGDDAQSLNAKINQYIRALDQRLGESEITPTPKSYAEDEQFHFNQAAEIPMNHCWWENPHGTRVSPIFGSYEQATEWLAKANQSMIAYDSEDEDVESSTVG